MKYTARELLEQRITEVQAQISNLEFTAHTILDRGKLRARLCGEYIELQQQLADLGAPMAPEIPTPKRANEDVLIMGTRRLKLLDAIERALKEANTPLDADDIAYIIVNNDWVRKLRHDSHAAVYDAIQRCLDRGNKLGICVLGEGKNRRYRLASKSLPATAT